MARWDRISNSGRRQTYVTAIHQNKTQVTRSHVDWKAQQTVARK